MSHPEDGPLDVKTAKGQADKILADPKSQGQPSEHAQSQKFENLADPTKQNPHAGPGPEWSQHGTDWVHEVDG